MSRRGAVRGRALRAIQVLSMLAVVYAILGYVNVNYLRWVDSFWLSQYSERIAIIAIGVWRVAREKNSYTRKRVAVLVSLVATVWILFPYLTGSSFFNNHLISLPWTFAYLVLVFAIGRRADCSYNCPCVGMRDTAGHCFAHSTPKKDIFWRLRHVKWVFVASAVFYVFLALAFPVSAGTRQFAFLYFTIVNGVYFFSFLVMPWTGNRNFCRYLCPWGNLFGAVGNKLGFFKIEADRDRCIYCDICERECHLGIPLRKLIRERGAIKEAECVGCGRCITACPKGALRFVDVRDYLGFPHKFPEPLKAKPPLKRQEEVPTAATAAPPGKAPSYH